MSKKDFIDSLYKRRSIFTDPDQAEMLANLLDTVSSDIYSEGQRFIFELIQNADDAALIDSNEIHFDFRANSLIVSHKGKSFDEADIYAIANAGKGTKATDATKTGYKGIGFKSVLGKSNRVTILSNGYNFRFDRELIKQSFDGIKMPWQIIPIWTESSHLHSEIFWDNLKETYNVSTIIELENSLGLKKDLNELLSNGKILLFLRNITKISISINGKSDYTIEKQICKIEESSNEVKLLKNDKELSSWIVTTFDNIPIDNETQIALNQDDKTPDKLKGAKFTEISFAAKIENGKLKEIKGEESLIFTYLPTKELDFKFPFLVNGSFLTNASREGIHEDRVWNQWLFQLIGEKIFDWFELLSKSKYKLQILHLLPNKFNSFYNELKNSFDKSFDFNAKHKNFIPNKISQLRKATEIIIDSTGLSDQDFIATETIIEYLNRETGKTYTVSSFVHPRLESKHKINSLGAYTFDLNNLEDFFVDEIFKKSHETKQNFKLINYFYQIDQSDATRQWHEKLKKIPFIYGNGGILRTPSQICFPYKSEETPNDKKRPTTIHKEVSFQIESNPEIKEWLRVLGVSEPNDIAYLQNEIIPNLEAIIDKKNFKDITRYIFGLHIKKELTHQHYQALNGLKLLCKDNAFHKASDCFLSDFYSPFLQLEKVYEHCNYVDKAYKENYDETTEWKLFFIKIGVSETISLKKIERSGTRELVHTFHCNPEFFWEYSSPQCYPNWSFYEYSITKISFIEKATDYKFSQLFWEVLLRSGVDQYQFWRESRGYWGENYMRGAISGDTLPPYNEWLIKNLPIIPTTTKTCLFPENVFLNSKEIKEIAGKYLPVLACETIPDDDWLNHLPFKQKLEVEDYLTIIKAIGIDTEKDEELKKINKKRLGLIYNKLTSLIPNLSQKKKNYISEWASSHKLLCDNGKFENPSELIWVKKHGFTNTSEHLKFLFIPENCETNPNGFKELLQLFGVQIIDDFFPEPKDKIEEDSLKKQLLLILPYFASIIERKSYEKNYSDEFNRLLGIINETKFYMTSEIVLSFDIQTEVISGPSLYAYLDKSNEKYNLFYKKNWSNQITLFSLIPEILKLFNLTDFTEELKLLIQLNENEIKDWCLEQGYNIVNENFTAAFSKSEKEIAKITTNDNYENEIKPSEASVLYDYSSIKTRISINEEAQEIIFDTLEDNGFIVDKRYNITYTILDGVLHKENGKAIKVVVKSAKAGRIYFTPIEWLALSEEDSQLFVLTAGNKVRNITIENLQKVNDEFHMRFNTEMFVLSNLKILADFFKRLPYTHFIFVAPESTTDYLQQFGLSQRNKSYDQLSDKDKQLYFSKDDDKTMH